MQTGDLVPDFTLPDQDGTPRTLSTLLRDGAVVLFFYPAAMTAGCTKEACHFRDLAKEFADIGAQRVGISFDDTAKQKRFADEHSFDYPLLADTQGTVADIFGVRRKRITPVQRATFVIGQDSRVRAVIKSELRMGVHADKALAALRT
jgi:peroxiredoxin Q/BCP